MYFFYIEKKMNAYSKKSQQRFICNSLNKITCRMLTQYNGKVLSSLLECSIRYTIWWRRKNAVWYADLISCFEYILYNFFKWKKKHFVPCYETKPYSRIQSSCRHLRTPLVRSSSLFVSLNVFYNFHNLF